MGNGINGQIPSSWKPQDLVNQWKNFCSSIMPLDSIMALTLWQGGPPRFGGNSGINTSTSIWNNVPFGLQQASLINGWDYSFSNITTPTTTTNATAETPQTQEEQDMAEAKRIQLNKKFETLKNILQDYASTLDEMDDTEGVLKVKINRLTESSVTQENYDKLLEIFNTNNVETSLKDKTLKSMLVSEDTSFKNKVGKDCWTKKNWSAKVRVTEDNVLEYIATFNEISNGFFTGTLFNRTIDKGSDNKVTNERSKIVEHLNDIQKSLITVALDICDSSNISEDSKQKLQEAIDVLQSSKPNEALCKSNFEDYENKLANLYNLTRMAKLESFEKEYEFLGLKFSDDEKKKLEDTKM